MKVEIVNSYFETQNIPSGVCQRSVLKSLWFLIFINNLPIDIKSEMELFVDNVKLLVRPLKKKKKKKKKKRQI